MINFATINLYKHVLKHINLNSMPHVEWNSCSIKKMKNMLMGKMSCIWNWFIFGISIKMNKYIQCDVYGMLCCCFCLRYLRCCFCLRFLVAVFAVFYNLQLLSQPRKLFARDDLPAPLKGLYVNFTKFVHKLYYHHRAGIWIPSKFWL